MVSSVVPERQTPMGEEPMPDPDRTVRYRLEFGKTDAMRYTSHLDLLRTWERLLRRSELPLYFSEGFRPRVRFNVAAALPLGFTGEREIADLYLTRRLDPAMLLERLSGAAPPGIEMRDAEPIDGRLPAVQTLVVSAHYRVSLPAEAPAEDLDARVTAFLASSTHERERRGRRYDLRTLVESIELENDVDGPALLMRLRAREGATGRPDEVLDALELDPRTARIVRQRLVLAEPGTRPR